MIAILINIETEIAKALQKTNGYVGWRVVAETVGGGSGRVLPVNRTTIVKFEMSTDGAQYTATKLQPTLTPFENERCTWWASNFAKLLKTKTQVMTVHLNKKWLYCSVDGNVLDGSMELLRPNRLCC